MVRPVKRAASYQKTAKKPYKAQKTSVAARGAVTGAARGYQRTAGFYGRFTGPMPELKFHDLDVDDASVAANGNIAQASCNLIAQGVTESQRIGRKCTIKSIGWRFRTQLLPTAVSNATGTVLRVILYLDKQCNGATATVTGILESDDFQSFNNLANKNRFRTLMDRTYDMNATSGSGRGSTDTLAFGENNCTDSYFAKVNLPIEFDSTTGAITEIRSNNIGVLLVTPDGTLMSFTSKMRLRFSDGS